MKTNKVLATTSIISALAVNVFASGVVTGPVEPNTTAPVATGYNSIAAGANTTVTASNSVALGRDNNITADNTVVIGGGNGNVIGGQSTVIGYNNTVDNSMEQTIIGANSQTSGQGAMALGTHTVVTSWDAVGIGNNILADKANSVALGTNSVTEDAVNQLQATVNNTTYVFAGTDATSVVSVGSKGRAGFGGVKNYVRQIQSVAAGRVDASSTDAINGSQLHAAYDAINGLGDTVASHTAALTNHEGRIQTLEQGTKEIKSNLANTQSQVNINTKDISDLKGKVGNNTVLTKQVNNNTKSITGLTAKTDANTTAISQVNDRVSDTNQRIDALDNRFYNVAQRMNKLGASSAALAGLHPLEYNKNDKGNFAISYGHYRTANAVALGAFYSPNEKVRLGFGITLGGETQFNINAAFRTGKGSEYESQAKNGELEQLRKEVAELKGLVTK